MSRHLLRHRLKNVVHSRRNTKWWLAGGVASANAVAAYRAVRAADLATSYVNLANPGTNNAAPGVAPTFGTATGWTFNGTTQYLDTGLVATGSWSALARFSAATFVVSATFFGSFNTPRGFYAQYTTGSTYKFANSSTVTTGASAAAGVVGMAGAQAYINGVASGAAIGSGTMPTANIFIGAFSNAGVAGGFLTGNILALAIYNTTLTATQVAAVTTAMNAL